MEIAPNSNRNSHVYGSKEGNDPNILIDCKAVVERKDFLSTGVLTYAQGDIIEIEIPQYEAFRLGDKVKVIIYTKTGMFVFDSAIIAKELGSLIILNPLENRKKFSEKREEARIDIQQNGFLRGLNDMARKRKHIFDEPIGIAVNNISMSGVGFMLSNDIGLIEKAHLEIELDLGFIIPCVAEIMRREVTAEGYYYGVRYVDIQQDKLNALRGFILKNQIETYFVRKKEEMHRKATQVKKPAANE